MDYFAPTCWRDKVSHTSPKALRIRAAVQAIHERGEYPGMRRVMREIGDPVEKVSDKPAFFVNGEPIHLTTTRWMSGRDNEVRKQMMRELDIKPQPDPFEGDYDPYWGYY